MKWSTQLTRAYLAAHALIGVTLAACVAHVPSKSRQPPGGLQDGSGSGPPYIVHETFNAMPSDAPPASPWITRTSAAGTVTVREVPFAVDKSVAIEKPDTTGTSSMGLAFPAQHGRIVVESKVMAGEMAGFKAIPYIYDSAGEAIASVSFQDGQIMARVGGTATAIQSFAANVWYRVRVVIDTDQGTFDLYIDGVRKEHAVALRTAASSIDHLSFYMDGANTGTLYVDNVKIYNETTFIGAAPTPVFDARTYGAAGDGTTDDTAAIQAAVNAAAGTGGSVLLSGGTFLSGTVTLGSQMTFFVDSSAELLGSPDLAAYPVLAGTGGTQLGHATALVHAVGASGLRIDGGGTIEGQAAALAGASMPPLNVWVVQSDHVVIQNVYVTDAAAWSLVSMESNNVEIGNVNVSSDGIDHDGIDIVDGSDIVVRDVAVHSGDDAMCLKSGVRRGLDTVSITDSMFSGSNRGTNGIKFGTASYGAFRNVSIVDNYVKDVQYAAMAVESRQGADVDAIAFRHIQFANAGTAFFVFLEQGATTHPVGDVPKLGSMNNVSFTDVVGATGSWPHSPHQGSLITGQLYNGVTYPITNLAFSNVAIAFDGGWTTLPLPKSPVEADQSQYPESNMFGDLPAWGYYLHHVQGVTFNACAATLASPDVRQEIVTDDVSGLSGTP
jgi:polygalacturonase